MSIIWYNSETQQYQKGEKAEFDQVRSQSNNDQSFQVVFEFNPTSARLIDKVYLALTKKHRQTNLSFANT